MLTFPTIGHGPKEWILTDDQVTAWQEAYPTLDVLQQCRMAQQWVLVNHKKTARGMLKFLVNWLNRAVQRGDVVTHVGAPMHEPWSCPHVQQCEHRWQCRDMKTLGRPEKAKAS
jgi:hypothetical protein